MFAQTAGEQSAVPKSLLSFGHFNCPGFCSSTHKPTIIHFVFLAKEKLLLVLLYLAKWGSFLGSAFSPTQCETWRSEKSSAMGKTHRYVQAPTPAYFCVIKLHPRLEPSAYKHRGRLRWRFYVTVQGWKEVSIYLSILYMGTEAEILHFAWSYTGSLWQSQELNWDQLKPQAWPSPKCCWLCLAGHVSWTEFLGITPSGLSLCPVWAWFSSET